MADTVKFPSATEVPIGYEASPVLLSEVDAIILKPLSADSSSIAEVGGNTQGTLYIDFIKGSLSKASIRIYGSYKANPGSGDWYQETIETDSAGTATLDEFVIDLTSNKKISYHIPLGAYKSFKITVEGIGASNTGSSIKLNIGLRTN